MRTIWKYQLRIADTQTVEMPAGADTLSVQANAADASINGSPISLWALVDPEAPPMKRKFEIRGTGHDCDSLSSPLTDYVGTVQLHGGALVFHVFDAGEAGR